MAAWSQDGLAGAPIEPPSTAAMGAGTSIPTVVLHSNIAGDPTAAVPGLPGIAFQPGTGTTHFDRVFGSPGGRWIISAFIGSGDAGNDEVILVDGVLRQREGDPASWTGDTELVGPIDQRLSVNDAGDWAFATNTDGDAASDEYVLKSTADVIAALAREGSVVPAIPGATWGASLESPALTASGEMLFVSKQLGGVLAEEDSVLVLGDVVLMREGITVPTGQVGSEAIENFDLTATFISADGAHWLVQGDLAGSTETDDVVVVDGAVVIQEGQVLAGSGFAEPVDVSGIIAVHMTAGGQWFARGNNDTSEQDWVYGSAGVVAAVGMPAIGNGGETWSDAEYADCFFMHVGDSAGNVVIGGVTSGPAASNGLLVYNGVVEVAREGDPVDIDGDGVFDDDLFISTFGNDDGHLADDGNFYVVVTLENGTGATVGQALLRIFLGGVDDIFADGFETP